jgi:hypothetical protein
VWLIVAETRVVVVHVIFFDRKFFRLLQVFYEILIDFRIAVYDVLGRSIPRHDTGDKR